MILEAKLCLKGDEEARINSEPDNTFHQREYEAVKHRVRLSIYYTVGK